MAIAAINGRRVVVPDVVTGEQLRAAGGIRPGRRIIRRTREGNFPVKADEQVQVNDNDAFVDCPARVKG